VESVVNQGTTQEPARRNNWADKKRTQIYFVYNQTGKKGVNLAKKGVKIEFSSWY
jgi:hypothetical protein